MKILLFDIETAPIIAKVWKIGKNGEARSMSMVVKDWYVLCWCAKWLDSKKIMSAALNDFDGYAVDKEDDRDVVYALWRLLDECDVAIAHNAKSFDVKKINARFLYYNMTPPSPYKVVDTLLVARRYFKFTSNKLDDLGNKLGLGRKTPTGGIELWDGCMAGDMKSWIKMVKYCKQDVKLLEKVYLRMLPYITNHPNVNIYDDEDRKDCPKCGSPKIHKSGMSVSLSGKKQRYRCYECGGWCTGDKVIKNAT